MSDMPTNVVAALARIMEELPAIAKVPHQSQGGRGITYAYRGIEEITAEAQALFAKYGVVCVPGVRSVDVREIVVNDNPWTDTTSVIDWSIYGPGGIDDVIRATTAGIGRDNSDKGANKAQTQAFKYLLLPMLMISDPKDDSDGTTVQASSRGGPSPRAEGEQSGRDQARRAAPPSGKKRGPDSWPAGKAPSLCPDIERLSEGKVRRCWAIAKGRGLDANLASLNVFGAELDELDWKAGTWLMDALEDGWEMPEHAQAALGEEPF